jgi:hypothetical protein
VHRRASAAKSLSCCSQRKVTVELQDMMGLWERWVPIVRKLRPKGARQESGMVRWTWAVWVGWTSRGEAGDRGGGGCALLVPEERGKVSVRPWLPGVGIGVLLIGTCSWTWTHAGTFWQMANGIWLVWGAGWALACVKGPSGSNTQPREPVGRGLEPRAAWGAHWGDE